MDERELRPDETTGTVDSVEFVAPRPLGAEREGGTYVTIRVDDPDIRWSAGRVAIRYLVK